MTDKPQQMDLMPEASSDASGPVECLGQTFPNDTARRDHYLTRLRVALEELDAKLGGVTWTTADDAVTRLSSLEHWQLGDSDRLRELAERMREAARGQGRGKDLLQLWKDEVGFPHGEMDDILRLSDPPYYTACPNPFIGEFIAYYGKPYDPTTSDYRREPFAADVSEGKSDPIYNAHTYHTKVPHKAIMRYILHYTDPGDIVLDGFSGSGMTGVAAQRCGDRTEIEEIGYTINTSGMVFQENTPISKIGARNVILNDLAPIATFITYNVNTPADIALFSKEATRILRSVETDYLWMYSTKHSSGGQTGKINYTVWSDVLVCPECQNEFAYWDAAVDYENNRVLDPYFCPQCGVSLSRNAMNRKMENVIDQELGQIVSRPKQIPVLINYSVGKQRFEKRPDSADMDLVTKVEDTVIPFSLPTNLMNFEGTEWGDLARGYHIGTTNVHQFYTKRNRWILAAVHDKISRKQGRIRNLLLAWFTSSHSRLTRMNRYMPNHGRHVGPLSGTYYLSSLPTEISPFYFLDVKLKEFSQINLSPAPAALVTTGSASVLNVLDESVDYIFTDPPFGDNLPYSELNFLWEAWLRAFTNTRSEAIVSQYQNKDVMSYQSLMRDCFREYYRVLKPGRWITVEFHNSRNSIWNAIQSALGDAGFVIADVRTLDKQKGTTKQLSYTGGAVKQDLVITAYKPNGGLEDRFRLEAGTENGVWDFVRTHLKQLPSPQSYNGSVETIAERQNYLLFDRMVAFHVQRGVTVPLSASEFYAGLEQRFSERDGMYFLPEQVAEYDRKRMTAKEVLQLTLFVTDEASAIQWLKQQLTKKPQTFQDLHPQFMRQIGGWSKHELSLELRDLLEQNFLVYDGAGEVPSQIHGYLSSNYKDLRNLAKDDPHLREEAADRWYVPDPNKAGDLEKLRERSLLREFAEYRESKARKLKVFRLEAVRAGFKKAWGDRDYETILAVAEKIPDAVLQEDPKLLMWYDQALTRSGK